MSIRSTIVTHTGRRFDFRDPRPESLDIRDFIETLPKQCRFTGHCDGFYSNAAHSMFVALILRTYLGHDDLYLEGLLHEGNEVYMNDVNSPLKGECPDYKAIQKSVEAAVAVRFRLRSDAEAYTIVKRADWMAYCVEQFLLMPSEATRVDEEAGRDPRAWWSARDAWALSFVDRRASRGDWRFDRAEFSIDVFKELKKRGVA